MTPRKANTPVREGTTEEINGIGTQATKTDSKKKRKKKILNMTKQDYIPLCQV